MPPSSPPLGQVLAGPLASRLGPKPMLMLPGDDSTNTPFIESATNIILANHMNPALAPHLFRRHILPVIPVPGDRCFIPMKPEYFVSWAERHFVAYKTRYDRHGDPNDVVRPMTKEVANVCLNSLEFTLAMPHIKRTYPIPLPVIPADGGAMTLCTPGFHPSTGAFVFEADFPKNPEYLTPESTLISSGGYYDDHLTLHEAVTRLHQLHAYMPFSDWSEPFLPTEDSPFFHPEKEPSPIRLSRSLAVQIMAMLAMFAGGCIPSQASRLGFCYNANQQRSGKTLLGKIVVYPVCGTCATQSWRESDEDMIKLLDSETLAATTYIFFDNVRGVVASPPLEGFMTTPLWTGRILGRSEMFKAENNALLILTGNNTQLGSDMQERTLIIDLYVESADRQDRDGSSISREHRLDDIWLSDVENRRSILSALWAIVRHWDAAGRPLASGRPRRGFDVFCEILGGMVQFAGFGDPLERPANLENSGDTESQDIRSLVEHCSFGVRARSCSFQEVVHILWEKGLLPWCLHGREEYVEDLQKVSLKLNDASNSRLGMLLQRNCSGDRGSTHRFKTPEGHMRTIRFYSRGKGRARRYHFDEITPGTSTPSR